MKNEEFAKKLIDKILDSADELNITWHYGEECVQVCDIIKLIREEANICIDYRCFICKNHYSKYQEGEHGVHCMGSEKICENYKCVLDD